MRKNFILYLIIVIIAGVFGYWIGRSSDPFIASVREAEKLAGKDIEKKKEAIEMLNKQKAITELAIKQVRIEEARQFIALALANQLIIHEMWNEALKYLMMCEELLPNDFTINYKMSLVYYNMFKFETSKQKKNEYYTKSLNYSEKAITIRPENANANYLYGLLLMEVGLYADAIPHFESIVSGYPDDVDTLFALGNAYYRVGEYDKASKIYLRLERLVDPYSERMQTIQKNLELVNQMNK